MSRYFLTKLRVEGFRGINNENQPLELSFKPDRVNSIFAANANGKSSIFEALCFAIRGHVPKLRALQVAEQPDKYVANLFHSASTAIIELALQDETDQEHVIRITRAANGQRTVTSSSGLVQPENVLNSLNEDFTLLDYEQFTNFINRTPLERGRSFAALLGLSGYSQLRQLLQSLSDTRNLNADFDLPLLQASAQTNEGYAKETFARFSVAYMNLTGQSPGDTSGVAKWGADIKEALLGIELLRPAIDGLKLSEIDFGRLRDMVRTEEGGAKRDELAKLVEIAGQLGSIDLSSVDTAVERASELKTAVATRERLLTATPGANYQKLQEAALHLYLSGEWHDEGQCALCKSDLREPLLPKVEAEVTRFEAVRAQEQTVRNLVDGAEWIRCLGRLEAVADLNVPEDEKIAQRVGEAAQRGSLNTDVIDEALERLTTLAEQLRTYLNSLNVRKSELEKELPPSLVAVTTQLEYASTARESLGSYWRATNELIKIRAKLAQYGRWQKYINAVTEEICRAEARHTAARLDALGDDYKQLFRNVMGVGDVVPVLSQGEHGEQLDVQLEDFHGLQGLSARALLSESYRNALAVSVFLSAAAQQTTAARFVVLDDVTSSFDAGHQWRADG